MLKVSKLKHPLIVGITLTGLLLSAAFADHGDYQGSALEDCLQAVSEIRSGAFIKVEYLEPSANGRATYEIEIRDADGAEWEFMCDARKARVYEIEQEADSIEDARFSKYLEISEEEARSAALELYPGKIIEREYEIESNGDPSYEFDIKSEGGREIKVEVSGVTGRVIEVHIEKWEIGEEPEESLNN